MADEAETLVVRDGQSRVEIPRSRDGRTVAEKIALDEAIALRASNAALTQRLMLAHAALNVEQTAHDETKARYERLKRDVARNKEVNRGH